MPEIRVRVNLPPVSLHLPCSSLIISTLAIVLIYDASRRKKVIELEFKGTVLRVRLGRTRLIVVLLQAIYVYDFPGVPQPSLLATYPTAANPHGAVGFLNSSQCCLLVYPRPQIGHFQIVDLTKLADCGIVPAHRRALVNITIDPSGQVRKLCGFNTGRELHFFPSFLT